MNLKSFIARVTKDGSQHKVLGVVLNDGTPLKSVEVKVDDGPWQPATLDPATQGQVSAGSCSPTPGTARRRASTRWCRASPTMNGKVQPTAAGARNEEVVPRRELAGHAKGHDCVGRGHICANVS